MKTLNWLVIVFLLSCTGCASSEIKPVELFPEDQCAQCRMTVSDEAFASEIITAEGEVFKFDDLGCLERFLDGHKDLAVGKIFVKDYDSRSWLVREQSTIVSTGLKTPMSSGLVAFSDSVKAAQAVQQYPPSQANEESKGCSCCKVKGS